MRQHGGERREAREAKRASMLRARRAQPEKAIH
jgi:hypothetical protein